MTNAFTFPGQGSQQVGMGAELAQNYETARRMFEEVDEALGQKLSQIAWEGPLDTLTLTENAQPALMAVSVAAVRVLEQDKGISLKDKVKFVAGHSLGEYSALTASGALGLADTARLLKIRGKAMQAAVPVGEGAMAAILGLDAAGVAAVTEAAAGDGVCTVANLNSPVQTVIAGSAAAVARAMELATAAGARRVIPLAVSAPFHSPLMAPAREGLVPHLESTEFREPTVPVVTNIDARPASSGAAARDALARQVDGPVRWVESVAWMVEEGGVEAFVEIGPGAVLTGLIRRIARGVPVINVGLPSDLDRFADLGE